MENQVNFIPLGSGMEREDSVLNRPRAIGKTREEQKAIALEIRRAVKKEKKKIKANDKRQRKQNAIMNRRMTRNNEKYIKNKERNTRRAIDLERQRLRYAAVCQAERLAAVYDPTGKMFNVGEVVVMPDGQVKSKEAIKKAAELRAQKEIEKAEEARVAAEKAKYREEKLKAQREGREVPPKPASIGLQPAASFYGGEQVAYDSQQVAPRKSAKLSKKQQRQIEMLKPKPVPPKPVIPSGISLPEGEENLLALWDITDEEISQRLNAQKRQKISAGKNLRKIQQEQKKFNRAMKVRRKQAAKAGVLWDPEKAKKEILGEMENADWGDDTSNSESASDPDSEVETNGKEKITNKSGDNEDSDSSSSSDSDSGSDSDSEIGPEKPKKKRKKEMPQVNRPRLNLDLLEQAAKIKQEQDEKKRNAKLVRKAERKAKAAQEAAKANATVLLAKSNTEQEQATQSTPISLLAEELADDLQSSKKRKRSSNDEPEQNGKKIRSGDANLGEEAKEALRKLERKQRKEEKKKARVARELDTSMITNKAKSKVESKDDKLSWEIAEREIRPMAENQDAENQGPRYVKIAEQWNPDALLGDAQRKVKFLKLLGGGKYLDKETSQQKAEREKLDRKKAKKERQDARELNAAKKERRTARQAEQIAKVQSDLEKQYDAGMKLKHEGGGHRRGLGA